MREFVVWMEGYAATGQRETAKYLGVFTAPTFSAACRQAVTKAGWGLSSYNGDRNTFWGQRFFETEAEARKSFG